MVAGKHVDGLRGRDNQFLGHLEGIDGIAAVAQPLGREPCMCGMIEE